MPGLKYRGIFLSKQVEIKHPDFVEHSLAVVFGAIKMTILYDGKAIKLNRRGRFTVADDNGQNREGDISSNLFKPVTLTIDGTDKIQISDNLPKWLYVFMALNLVLISGGAIGGALMGLNLAFDRTVFLSDKSVAIKALLCLGLTLASMYLLVQIQLAFR